MKRGILVFMMALLFSSSVLALTPLPINDVNVRNLGKYFDGARPWVVPCDCGNHKDCYS